MSQEAWGDPSPVDLREEAVMASEYERAPSPSVGADGLPDLPEPNSVRSIETHIYTTGDLVSFALAALASRSVGDGGADSVDAERYRFIRDADKSDDLIPELSLYAMESLDQYIDSAMREFAARTAGTDTAGGA